MESITLIIADDHMLFIDGLRLLLKDEPDLEIVDIANDGKELLQVLRHRPASMVLLDINMPKLNGLDAIPYIRMQQPALKIILLSTYSEEHLIDKAKAAGANGYLLKNAGRDELLQTIRLVHTGHGCFPYQAPKAEPFPEDAFLKRFLLTKRERELLGFIRKGYTNQQISGELFLSIYTIETHRRNIMHKLQLKSPAALMKFIMEHNL